MKGSSSWDGAWDGAGNDDGPSGESSMRGDWGRVESAMFMGQSQTRKEASSADSGSVCCRDVIVFC